MTTIMDGKKLSRKIRKQVKLRAKKIKQKYDVTPTIATILANKDPASRIYVNKKHKACQLAGINTLEQEFSEKQVSEAHLLRLIKKLNKNESVKK